MERPGIIPAGSKEIPESWFVRLDAYLRALTWRQSNDINVAMGPGGTTGSVKKTGTAQQLPKTPFQVVNLGSKKIGVISDSHVINASDKDTYEEDNSEWGLLEDDPTSEDSHAIDIDGLSIGDKIWLQFTFDAEGNLTDISIEYGTVCSDAWDEFPDPISINTDDPANPYQEFFHQIIAEVTDPEQDPRPGMQLTQTDTTAIQITQILSTNLALVDARTTDDADEPGLDIMVAIPLAGAAATDIDGSADPIDPTPDIKTPWVLGSLPDKVYLPFEPYDMSDEDGDKVAIADGSILLTPKFKDNLTIMGLGDDGAIDIPEIGEYIWLNVTVDDNGDGTTTPSAAEIQTGTPDWDDDDPIQIDTSSIPIQTDVNLPLCEIVDPSDDRTGLVIGEKKIISMCHSNQILFQMAYKGVVAWFLQPWEHCGSA